MAEQLVLSQLAHNTLLLCNLPTEQDNIDSIILRFILNAISNCLAALVELRGERKCLLCW
jgi:hypothetical protein